MKLQVKEFAELTGVSVRTLHYYDEVGLLKPAVVDKNTGYRFYNEESVLRMQEILFYRELDFSLKCISDILSSPGYDREKALREQKVMLTMKKDRLERLIASIDNAIEGDYDMNAFDNTKFEAYKKETKERWGNSDAYREYSEKTKDYSRSRFDDLAAGLDAIFAEFSECLRSGEIADGEAAQALVEKLKSYISGNYYTCTNEILAGLGQMYTADERFRGNIDKHGEGTAAFAGDAIKAYCVR